MGLNELKWYSCDLCRQVFKVKVTDPAPKECPEHKLAKCSRCSDNKEFVILKSSGWWDRAEEYLCSIHLQELTQQSASQQKPNTFCPEFVYKPEKEQP